MQSGKSNRLAGLIAWVFRRSRLPKSSEWRNPLLSRINGSAQKRLFLGKQVRFRRSYLEIVSGSIVITVCRIH